MVIAGCGDINQFHFHEAPADNGNVSKDVPTPSPNANEPLSDLLFGDNGCNVNGCCCTSCCDNMTKAPEVCDGADNDGDALVDNEDFDLDLSLCESRTRANAIGCNLGQCIYECAPGYSDLDGDLHVLPGEFSNGCETGDNDEICDGLDNNGDGNVDENPDELCSHLSPPDNSQFYTCNMGACELQPCPQGFVNCDGVGHCELVPLPDSTCNGIDEDCNGIVDDGPIVLSACDTGELGVCADGQESCTDGQLICNRLTDPSTDICDGLDNDCDGTLDEDHIPASCYPDDPEFAGTEGVGECQPGTLNCVAGAELCEGFVTPNPESPACDAFDDDCDGDNNNGIFLPPLGDGAISINDGVDVVELHTTVVTDTLVFDIGGIEFGEVDALFASVSTHGQAQAPPNDDVVDYTDGLTLLPFPGPSVDKQNLKAISAAALNDNTVLVCYSYIHQENAGPISDVVECTPITVTNGFINLGTPITIDSLSGDPLIGTSAVNIACADSDCLLAFSGFDPIFGTDRVIFGHHITTSGGDDLGLPILGPKFQISPASNGASGSFTPKVARFDQNGTTFVIAFERIPAGGAASELTLRPYDSGGVETGPNQLIFTAPAGDNIPTHSLRQKGDGRLVFAYERHTGAVPESDILATVADGAIDGGGDLVFTPLPQVDALPLTTRQQEDYWPVLLADDPFLQHTRVAYLSVNQAALMMLEFDNNGSIISDAILTTRVSADTSLSGASASGRLLDCLSFTGDGDVMDDGFVREGRLICGDPCP